MRPARHAAALAVALALAACASAPGNPPATPATPASVNLSAQANAISALRIVNDGLGATMDAVGTARGRNEIEGDVQGVDAARDLAVAALARLTTEWAAAQGGR